MHSIQEIADTIQEFENRKAIALTIFEKVMQKKTPEVRKNIVAWFMYDAEEMIEHGYHSHYRGELKDVIQKNCRFYTDEKTNALLMAYCLSDPKERETFRQDILIGNIKDRISDLKPNPKMKKIKTEILGSQLMEYQLDLVRPYRHFDRKPHVVLNMIAELQKQPAVEKEKVIRLVKDSLDITKAGGLEAGVPYLANRLLPYFYKECSQKSAEINRPEKIKRTKSILHSFAWLLLNQNKSDAVNDIRRGLFPMTKAQLKALFKFADYDY